MTNVETIGSIVRKFQEEADRRFATYNEKVGRIRERYKDEAAKMEIMQNVWPEAQGTLSYKREAAKEQIEEVCETIREDLRKWTLKPVSPNTLQLLHSIHDFKIKLSMEELKMIEGEVRGNLIASKIFAGLAAEYGYYVAIPSVDNCLQELRELESFAKTAIDAYAGRPGKGGQFPGNDLLDKRTVNGVPMGEYQVWEKMIAADFTEKNKSMERTAELLEASKVDLKYSLTKKETARIKGLVDAIENDSISNSQKKEKMTALLQSEPDMAAKISLMDAEIKDTVVSRIGGKLEE